MRATYVIPFPSPRPVAHVEHVQKDVFGKSLDAVVDEEHGADEVLERFGEIRVYIGVPKPFRFVSKQFPETF